MFESLLEKGENNYKILTINYKDENNQLNIFKIGNIMKRPNIR